MSEKIDGLRNKFRNWKKVFERQGLKVDIGKAKMMVSGGVAKDGSSKSNVYSCWFCSLKLNTKSVREYWRGS